jgi:hypothetical protein
MTLRPAGLAALLFGFAPNAFALVEIVPTDAWDSSRSCELVAEGVVVELEPFSETVGGESELELVTGRARVALELDRSYKGEAPGRLRAVAPHALLLLGDIPEDWQRLREGERVIVFASRDGHGAWQLSGWLACSEGPDEWRRLQRLVARAIRKQEKGRTGERARSAWRARAHRHPCLTPIVR